MVLHVLRQPDITAISRHDAKILYNHETKNFIVSTFNIATLLVYADFWGSLYFMVLIGIFSTHFCYDCTQLMSCWRSPPYRLIALQRPPIVVILIKNYRWLIDKSSNLYSIYIFVKKCHIWIEYSVIQLNYMWMYWRSCVWYLGAVEKQKLVYILNRDAQARLTISSPLEAHKSNTLVYHMVGVDVGFENPTFACLEIDYEVRLLN